MHVCPSLCSSYIIFVYVKIEIKHLFWRILGCLCFKKMGGYIIKYAWIKLSSRDIQ